LHELTSNEQLGLSGHGSRSGLRLMAMYALSELPCVLSGGSLFMCDPAGRYLAGHGKRAGEMGGEAAQGSSVGRVYPLVPADLPQRFPDAFAPLALFGFDPLAGMPLDGTLLRLPLRSHALAVESSLGGPFWSVARASALLCEFERHAAVALLGLDTLARLSTYEWNAQAAAPTRTQHLKIELPRQQGQAQRGALRRDTSWRKTTVSSLLGRGGSTQIGAMLGLPRAPKRECVYTVEIHEVHRAAAGRGMPEGMSSPLTASPGTASARAPEIPARRTL
jgi:hypothetical protein